MAWRCGEGLTTDACYIDDDDDDDDDDNVDKGDDDNDDDDAEALRRLSLLKLGTQTRVLKVLMSTCLFLCYRLRVLMLCTSVSAVLIRSLNFCVI